MKNSLNLKISLLFFMAISIASNANTFKTNIMEKDPKSAVKVKNLKKDKDDPKFNWTRKYCKKVTPLP
ncbi:MAG TPA: hypothetical protein VN026_07775 [Bacteroidia bacterium]|jgi:hypothetical protein|nr:hypothetical protein [Bacteroidia bacterium]